ncbi:DUF2069 domain-containing protein [Roseateles oligotrophus]|uniref:DUF2069 domain-containing protein n=1 Tax=Roseateles oligotrophus TaxID=1769250 RepID=A0ABT2YG32_9BURK|nr:DUF2069 domain-containing protein [Roseateles oligotrophus]MCV2369004.1 DUF2069 domain-containing protein [Roseateles oligotrophus]
MSAYSSQNPPSPPQSQRTQASSREAFSRNLALGALIALFILSLAWELWLAPTGRGTLAIKALPLALPMLGLWRYRLYTFRWLSLMIWLYFAEGAVRAASEGGVGMRLAMVEVFLSVLIFVACAMQVRLRLAAAKAHTAGDEPA